MKPRLVLLHGWAVNSLIWSPILDQLRSRHEVTILDLPGYGSAADYQGDYSIDAVVENVMSRAPESANWIAWSLGGTIAISAAIAQPHRFEKLQLISTTPRFLNSENWKHGVEAGPLEKLADGFDSNYSKALKKFLLLQTFAGDPAQRKPTTLLVGELTSLLGQSDPPSQQTLRSGLELLRRTDLREQIGQLTVETQVIAGETDRVVPVTASKYLFGQLANGHSFKSLPGGHLPFLQSPSGYIEALRLFHST